ncbi:MAG: hypothetical protein Fur0044_15500 [Anaerolineae bacterium]|nr:hypothetical protein [Anaerolineales bacterium]MCQ3973964.1 hypothetical protein [Anaerolineae bacterium]
MSLRLHRCSVRQIADPTGQLLLTQRFDPALGAGLLGLFTGADELMDGLALLGRAANKLSPLNW